MKNEAKVIKGREEGLTAPDLRLSEFVQLNSEIKALTKRLDQIKAEIKHQGSYSTQNFIAVVQTVETETAPGKAKLIELFGPSVAGHFVKGSRTTVSVQRKG